MPDTISERPVEDRLFRAVCDIYEAQETLARSSNPNDAFRAGMLAAARESIEREFLSDYEPLRKEWQRRSEDRLLWAIHKTQREPDRPPSAPTPEEP